MEDVKRLKSKEIRKKSIAEKLAFNNEDSHLKGEAMPASQQVYRIKVVTCFLRAGVRMRPCQLVSKYTELK